MTVDPNTGRKHTVGMVEKAMTEVGFSVQANKPGKAQALDLIKTLATSSTLPIQRVRMRIRITMPSKDGKRCREKIVAEVEEVEEEDMGTEWEAVCLVLEFRYPSMTDY